MGPTLQYVVRLVCGLRQFDVVNKITSTSIHCKPIRIRNSVDMPKTFPEDGRVHAAGVLLMTQTHPPEFLLMRHPKRWDLPKGHREPGESDRETALREMEEEIGVPADAVTLDPDFQFQLEYEVTYTKRPGEVFLKQVTYFLGSIPRRPKVTVTEHPDFRWWSWDPPHSIQEATIDPLLKAAAEHLARR